MKQNTWMKRIILFADDIVWMAKAIKLYMNGFFFYSFCSFSIFSLTHSLYQSHSLSWKHKNGIFFVNFSFLILSHCPQWTIKIQFTLNAKFKSSISSYQLRVHLTGIYKKNVRKGEKTVNFCIWINNFIKYAVCMFKIKVNKMMREKKEKHKLFSMISPPIFFFFLSFPLSGFPSYYLQPNEQRLQSA